MPSNHSRPDPVDSSDHGSPWTVEHRSPSALEPLFGENIRVRTIQFLVEHREQAHTRTAIADELDVSTAMVSRACNDLDEYGLLDYSDTETDTGKTYTGVKLADTEFADRLEAFVHIATQIFDQRE